MRRVGLIDITAGNATRLGASQRSRHATQRVAPHRYATLEPPGKPGGSRAFSADGPRNDASVELRQAECGDHATAQAQQSLQDCAMTPPGCERALVAIWFGREDAVGLWAQWRAA